MDREWRENTCGRIPRSSLTSQADRRARHLRPSGTDPGLQEAHREGSVPGQWGLPGGGVEPGERLEEALRREVREEVGLELEDIRPLHFKEGVEAKHLGRGQEVSVPMVYLLFSCTAATTNVNLNDEFVEFAWVMPSELPQVDLNAETIRTFKELGILHDGAA
jgi:nucleoside triphosphatase